MFKCTASSGLLDITKLYIFVVICSLVAVALGKAITNAQLLLDWYK